MRAAVLGLALVGAFTGAAQAELPTTKRTISVPTPRPAARAQTAKVLYMNRCKGGCTFTKSTDMNHAPSHTTYIPNGAPGQMFNLTEFALGDAEWTELMQCIRDVYSPYDVQVVDEKPVDGVFYNEGVIAGVDSELGIQGAYGIAPVDGNCNPIAYSISFTFANSNGINAKPYFLCAVVAQETGHAFGLDHSYEFVDGTSACRDPMSYREDCGGQRFFRNQAAFCGENSKRPCRCGQTQNAHLKLNAALGAATATTEPPTVTVTSPAPGATVAAGAPVIATAGAQRGIDKLELWVNDYKWAEVRGAAFGFDGQPESAYTIALPDELPDGVMDLVVKAKDDLGTTTDSATVRVTKGAACTSADSCLAGQRCDDEGRCLWDPPVGNTGDECTFQQYCVSGICASTGEEMRCSSSCVPQNPDSCPAGFECLEDSKLCWPAETAAGGCCSANTAAGAQSALLAFGLAALFVRRRRR